MKTYITDCDQGNVDIELETYRKAGMPIEFIQSKDEATLIERCKDADILLNQYALITRNLMSQLKNLKLVVRYGVGYNNIDVDAATDLGIQVCNVPDYCTEEVAQHAFALMMCLTRKIPLMHRQLTQKGWDYTPSRPIHRYSAMTVGVLGLGRIGRVFAGLARGLGCRIVGYDPIYTPSAQDNSLYIEKVSLEDALRQADVISVHCPYVPDLIGDKEFSLMKKNAVIINVSRGGIINEPALMRALDSGAIAGAGLDCFAQEPMQAGASLFARDNVIVTPHMAWYSEEAFADLKRKIAEEGLRFARGEAVRYPVNTVPTPRK